MVTLSFGFSSDGFRSVSGNSPDCGQPQRDVWLRLIFPAYQRDTLICERTADVEAFPSNGWICPTNFVARSSVLRVTDKTSCTPIKRKLIVS